MLHTHRSWISEYIYLTVLCGISPSQIWGVELAHDVLGLLVIVNLCLRHCHIQEQEGGADVHTWRVMFLRV